MLMTFGCMFNLILEFFFGSKIPPTFNIVAQSCSRRYKFARIDKGVFNTTTNMEHHVNNSIERLTFSLI